MKHAYDKNFDDVVKADDANDSELAGNAKTSHATIKKGHDAKKIKALLIDDNYEFYNILNLTLADDFALDYAPDGFTAFQMVRREHYDVVLCDIFMPLISGLTLLAEFKKKNITTPFVFVTGNADDKIVKEALSLGAYNLLEKPFGKDDLLGKVQRALALHAQQEPNQLADQDKAYIYNTLKTYYYDVEKIMRSINQINMPVATIHTELDKKIRTGKCMFDDLANLRFYRQSS